jgi:hypothetical protein
LSVESHRYRIERDPGHRRFGNRRQGERHGVVRYTAALSRAWNVRQRHAFDGQGKLSVTLTWER